MWAPHFRMESIFFPRGNALRQSGCLFDENMNLRHVFALGQQMMRDGEIVVKGTFEE